MNTIDSNQYGYTIKPIGSGYVVMDDRGQFLSQSRGSTTFYQFPETVSEQLNFRVAVFNSIAEAKDRLNKVLRERIRSELKRTERIEKQKAEEVRLSHNFLVFQLLRQEADNYSAEIIEKVRQEVSQ